LFVLFLIYFFLFAFPDNLKLTTTLLSGGPRNAEIEALNSQHSGSIGEIVSAGEFVFVLTDAGVCGAFHRRKKFLNTNNCVGG
jgi:hypothetical protein